MTNIKLAHPIIDDAARAAVLDALNSGQLAQGPRVAAFEATFAAYTGTEHAVAVCNGTAALHLALLAHGIGSAAALGQASSVANRQPPEVVVPAFSFAATANAVLLAGARPVFVDVREDDFGINIAQIEAAITPQTRAVIAVHLYGQMCDIEPLRVLCEQRSIVLIEDAAQAIGATLGGRQAGSFGTGCFSFYATKNLQTGEGGMITTNDDTVAARARVLRSQGETSRYVTEEVGYNYRLTEIAAALGLAQMPTIDARNDARRANAARLSELLRGASGIVTPRELPGRRHVYHQYTIRTTDAQARDALQARLRDRGIESATFYPTPIHRQPLYLRLGYGDVDLPVSQRLATEVLSLPVHPALTADDLETIAAAVLARD